MDPQLRWKKSYKICPVCPNFFPSLLPSVHPSMTHFAQKLLNRFYWFFAWEYFVTNTDKQGSEIFKNFIFCLDSWEAKSNLEIFVNQIFGFLRLAAFIFVIQILLKHLLLNAVHKTSIVMMGYCFLLRIEVKWGIFRFAKQHLHNTWYHLLIC